MESLEKWKYIYFEVQISNFKSKVPTDKRLKIINGTTQDLKKIEEDLFPFFTHKQEYDKRFIYKLGEDGINCFLAEKKGKFVHYFMVFSNAKNSPLAKTTFNKKEIKENDIYLGNAFTVPLERGSLILPSVLKFPTPGRVLSNILIVLLCLNPTFSASSIQRSTTKYSLFP